MTMKSTINISVPIILTISLVLLLNTGISNANGQIVGDTNQTQPQQDNQTQPQQDNQTQPQQDNQTQPQQDNQTQPQQDNQTQPQQDNQTQPQQDPKMNEKLLNYTNAAILALNDDNTTAAQDSLVQLQNALINASGKQVVVIPAPALQIDDDDEDSD
jgi:outer membrane biosynthesis protein TonB